MELFLLAGCACVAWTAAELGRAAARPSASFGAIDGRGRPLDVVLDRRAAARGRRTDDAASLSLRV